MSMRLCCASWVVTSCVYSFTAFILFRKVFTMVGGRVSTDFAAVGGLTTCGVKIKFQSNIKGGSYCPP